ncbi:MAG: hypothetical protein KatS3mg081_2939 [Gemmatimonadales bacterium]|nr:MAG: hypothetical protein KatS3mg081_2939 [Gemmatimonadales bacterium]
MEQLSKTAAVLRRKREALVAELLRSATPAAEAREAVLEEAQRAYPALLRALGRLGAGELEALAWPSREFEVEMATARVWGVTLARINGRLPILETAAAQSMAAPFTSRAAWEAAREFGRLVQLLLYAGEQEVLMRRLGTAVSQVSRQVNTLEKRVAAILESQERTLRRALEEREREEHSRYRRLLRIRSEGAARDLFHGGHFSPRQHISQNSHS